MKKLYIIIPIMVLALLSIFFVCSCSKTVTLYFASMVDSRPYLIGETRQIEDPGNIYKTAVEELIKGPLAKGLYPTIPSDTVVNSVTVSDGLATVDFNIRIINNFEEIPHSSGTETLAIYSIVNTLTEFKDIERVKITIGGLSTGEVDGYMVEDFWGHIGIYEIFERNEEIIKDE
ncbi:MAG: GerMN domain-containing protein [Actinomycetia bacterium]|nr:GerMN domain-containing protein [Actinomycetes bacterium]